MNTFGPTGLLTRHGASEVGYTFDPEGNVSQQVSLQSGTVLSNYAFTAFGTRAASSTNTNYIDDPFTGFKGEIGQYFDYQTGLMLCGRRYYNPASGRFLTRDPIGPSGGADLYEDCSNNQLALDDTTGCEGTKIGGGDGGWSGVFMDCLASGVGAATVSEMMKILSGDGASTSAMLSILCSGGLECLSAIGGQLVKMGLSVAFPGFTLVAGCGGGFAESLLSDLSDFLCSLLNPCKEGINWLCDGVNVVIDTIEGCVGDEWQAGQLAVSIITEFVGSDIGEICKGLTSGGGGEGSSPE